MTTPLGFVLYYSRESGQLTTDIERGVRAEAVRATTRAFPEDVGVWYGVNCKPHDVRYFVEGAEVSASHPVIVRISSMRT